LLRDDRQVDEKFLRTLQIIAPGTQLHEGLEHILRARTGALIVVGDTEATKSLVNGGFLINCEYSPSYIYELSKMDGAIVLSSDTKRILWANTQLIPDSTIPTQETGTRHRTAERVAKQTGELVICISQRQNVITIYKGPIKYVVRDVGVLLAKATQAIGTLEKYKAVLDQSLHNLSALEFEDLVTLGDVATTLQRYEMVRRVTQEIEKYICELGTEGRLVRMQLEELVVDVDDDGTSLIKDYMVLHEERSPDSIRNQLASWSSEDLLDHNVIVRALGYTATSNSLDQSVSPRGYRALTRVPRLPFHVIEKLVSKFQSLQKVMSASIEALDDVEGIGEVRAKAIKEGLRRVREHALIDKTL
jgi:diadenylate cyclase